MAGFNKAILVGNLGSDPQIRTIENGTKVASFNIATSETYIDKDNNRQEKTEWHRIVAWKGWADFAEKSLKKGSRVFIEGKITNRTYEQDGVTKNISEIVVFSLVPMSSTQSGTYNSVTPPSEDNSRPTSNTNSSVGANPTTHTSQKPEPRDNDVVINDPTDDLPF